MLEVKEMYNQSGFEPMRTEGKTKKTKVFLIDDALKIINNAV